MSLGEQFRSRTSNDKDDDGRMNGWGVGVKVMLLSKTRAVTGKMKYASRLPVKNRLDKWRLLS